ncbi:MAG: dicarboxylate/amino acid:cation symporter [Gemmatimonadetes bacterium]|nr:dicarboxylate/amino acid:cation symporter [Gemmatimonadota bacterium]
MKIHVAIALGLLGGLSLGLVAALTGSPALLTLAGAVEPVGTAFVNLLKMVVVPLVATTLFVGVAGMGDLRRLGQVGTLALAFFAATTLIGVLLGMGVMQALLPFADQAAARGVSGATHAPAGELPGVVDFLVGLIPANPVQAAAESALLPLIVFTILFAAAAGALPEPRRRPLIAMAEAITAALITLVHWVLWVAPVGVFALAAPVFARSGWAMLQSLMVFILAVLVGLVVFVAAVYLPAAAALGSRGPARFLQACLGSQLIGFTTTSSPATIPAMLDSADALGVSRDVSGLVIPLGASLNRAGSALFQGASVVFLAWLYGTPLPLASLGGAVLATFLVAFTVAGVPSASVVSLAPALSQVGVPLDGLGVLLGVDRIPDMLRTATNVTGTITAAAVLERRYPSSVVRYPSAAGGGGENGQRRTDNG